MADYTKWVLYLVTHGVSLAGGQMTVATGGLVRNNRCLGLAQSFRSLGHMDGVVRFCVDFSCYLETKCFLKEASLV